MNYQGTLNESGEPTQDFVVNTWDEVPRSIAGHTLMGFGRGVPGVFRHARLGITFVVLDMVVDAFDRAKAEAEKAAVVAKVAALEIPPTCDCGHPTEDHSAGECWWDVTHNRQDDDPEPGNGCPCDGLAFTGHQWGPVDGNGRKREAASG